MANRFSPSAPNRTLWIIALLLGILGIIVHYYPVNGVSEYSWELVMIGFLLLVLGTVYRKI
jgi:energy-converting hydrogenase Eha subunit C